jgi:hypothetical protein
MEQVCLMVGSVYGRHIDLNIYEEKIVLSQAMRSNVHSAEFLLCLMKKDLLSLAVKPLLL